MTYAVPSKPSSVEHGSYNRNENVFFWTTRTNIAWEWRLDSAASLTQYNNARFIVDGSPVTDWIAPKPVTNAAGAVSYYVWPFVFNAENGHHLGWIEVQGVTVENLKKPFVVNDTGAPLATQRPWVATTRFQRTYIGVTNAQAQVTYPGARPTPKIFPYKPREIKPWGTVLTKDKLWVRALQENVAAALTSRFAEIPTGAVVGGTTVNGKLVGGTITQGDIVVEGDNKYFYDDATDLTGRGQIGRFPPVYTLRDGPRGVGTFGPVYKIVHRATPSGFYFAETTGRLGFMRWDGTISTLAGWRLKSDAIKVHAGVLSVQYQYAADKETAARHKDYYNSKWELVGNWDQVVGPKTFFESWGFAVAERMADGSIDNRDGHEIWMCDTLHHRIVFVDHWTAHSASTFQSAQFPPPNYVQSPGPIGMATLCSWGGNTDGTPSEFFNEPWDCEVNPADGKLYWTNFGNGTICRADLNGTNFEVVVRTAQVFTSAQLAGRRLERDRAQEPKDVRTLYLKDGGPGVATIICPQAMGFTSEGKLIFAERYTYALRELDLQTRVIRTLAPIMDYNTGSTSSGNNDIAMSINVDGTCGVKDDIIVNCWGNSDFQFSKDGVKRGRPFFVSGAHLRSGPLSLCDSPGYAWGVGIGGGRMTGVGNAGGWQFQEITQRLPTDPTPDAVKWYDGHNAYYQGTPIPMSMLHGPDGQGELGYPRMEEMGSWDDAKLRAYGLANGIASTKVDSWMTNYVRFNCIDFEYPTAPQEDPAVIAELQATIAQLTTQINALEADRDAQKVRADTAEANSSALQAKIAAARAAAQADKDADAASAAGQGVLDALS